MKLYGKRAVATIALILLSTSCTQKQQSAISSSDWQTKLDVTVDDLRENADTKLEHTGNWFKTESEISNLQASVDKTIDNGEVTSDQAASLRNSLDWIRRLQQQSIESAGGIDDAEKAQIAAAIDRVETRMSGWLASGPQQNM